MLGTSMLAAVAANTRPGSTALQPSTAALLQQQTEQAFGTVNASHSIMRLRFCKNGTFGIAQITDTHLGEHRPERRNADAQTMRLINSILDQETVDFAVLTGDQITGHQIDANASTVWQTLTDELNARGLPHTAILGNHDGEPYIEPKDFEYLDAHPDEYSRRQNQPGAHLARERIMVMDSALPGSYSQQAPTTLLPASSTYVLDVLPLTGDRPLLTLYHLDTGGGGIMQDVNASQVSWLETELSARQAAYGEGADVPPAIVFAHIPLHLHADAWDRQDHECFGDKADDISPPSDGSGDVGLGEVLQRHPQVKSVFVGHDHCNDFCCRTESSQQYMCYGRHSGLGGKQCDGFSNGMRLIHLDVWEGGWRLRTHVRLWPSMNVSQQGTLAEAQWAMRTD